MTKKILVAAPTYEKMSYCEERFLERLKSLDYENYDILLVDNSRNEDYSNHLKNTNGIIVLKDETNEEKNINRLISSRNKILDYALKKDYDFILMMDSDVRPPVDVIKKLLSTGKPLVSGLYLNYFYSSGQLKLLPVSWKGITPEEFESIKVSTKLPEWVKDHTFLKRHLTKEEADSNKLHEVIIPSGGCLLISREIFENFSYRNYGNESATDDLAFFEDLRKEGITPYCLTSVKCDHLVDGKFRKDEEGNLHHPVYD